MALPVLSDTRRHNGSKTCHGDAGSVCCIGGTLPSVSFRTECRKTDSPQHERSYHTSGKGGSDLSVRCLGLWSSYDCRKKNAIGQSTEKKGKPGIFLLSRACFLKNPEWPAGLKCTSGNGPDSGKGGSQEWENRLKCCGKEEPGKKSSRLDPALMASAEQPIERGEISHQNAAFAA